MSSKSKSKSKKVATAPTPEELARAEARAEAKRAKTALFAAYKAGDRSTPQLQAIQVVQDGVKDLKAKIEDAISVNDFKVCRDIAAYDLYEKADLIEEWADPLASMFITDTLRWCTEASEWLEWDAANPELAARNAYEIARWNACTNPDSDAESVESTDSMFEYEAKGPEGLCTESAEQAREWALRSLQAFETSMM